MDITYKQLRGLIPFLKKQGVQQIRVGSVFLAFWPESPVRDDIQADMERLSKLRPEDLDKLPPKERDAAVSQVLFGVDDAGGENGA